MLKPQIISIVFFLSSIFSLHAKGPDLNISLASYNQVMKLAQELCNKAMPGFGNSLPMMLAGSLKFQDMQLSFLDKDKPIYIRAKLPLNQKPQMAMYLPIKDVDKFKANIANQPVPLKTKKLGDYTLLWDKGDSKDFETWHEKSAAKHPLNVRLNGSYVNDWINQLYALSQMMIAFAGSGKNASHQKSLQSSLQFFDIIKGGVGHADLAMIDSGKEFWLQKSVSPAPKTKFADLLKGPKRPVENLKGLWTGKSPIESMGTLNLSDENAALLEKVYTDVYTPILGAENAKAFVGLSVNILKEVMPVSFYYEISEMAPKISGVKVLYRKGLDGDKVISFVNQMTDSFLKGQKGKKKSEKLYEKFEFKKNFSKVEGIAVHKLSMQINLDHELYAKPEQKMLLKQSGMDKTEILLASHQGYLVGTFNNSAQMNALLKKIKSGKCKGSEQVVGADIKTSLNLGKLAEAAHRVAPKKGVDPQAKAFMAAVKGQDVTLSFKFGMTKALSFAIGFDKQAIAVIAQAYMAQALTGFPN